MVDNLFNEIWMFGIKEVYSIVRIKKSKSVLEVMDEKKWLL